MGLSLCTKPLSTLHQEYIFSLITITTTLPIILGFPWMHLHDLELPWYNKEITIWSSHCMNHCLHLLQLVIAPTTLEIPETQAPTDIPTEYQELQEAFCKAKGSGLPPHRPYDCAIELLPSTILAGN